MRKKLLRVSALICLSVNLLASSNIQVLAASPINKSNQVSVSQVSPITLTDCVYPAYVKKMVKLFYSPHMKILEIFHMWAVVSFKDSPKSGIIDEKAKLVFQATLLVTSI